MTTLWITRDDEDFPVEIHGRGWLPAEPDVGLPAGEFSEILATAQGHPVELTTAEWDRAQELLVEERA